MWRDVCPVPRQAREDAKLEQERPDARAALLQPLVGRLLGFGVAEVDEGARQRLAAVERAEQSLSQVARQNEKLAAVARHPHMRRAVDHRSVGEHVRREEAAEEADGGLEDGNVDVDVKVDVLRHPPHAPRKLARVADHGERVERVDEREGDAAVAAACGPRGCAQLHERVRVAARDWPQLVVREGPLHVAVKRVIKHLLDGLTHLLALRRGHGANFADEK
mmetsp:Transcript_24150/g.77519  ORF Transcript_24150/g.77519 Transcript_24150/m.77519 type:complete len:221 (+) Transcript_24150:530-1192(+)